MGVGLPLAAAGTSLGGHHGGALREHECRSSGHTLSGAGVLTEAGFKLGHRVGHGIGLATSFEWPSLDHEDSPLQPGMTFCLEPGVYEPGAGNMKLEDDVLVTEDGVESLTNASRELLVA
jgi:Xaa-Pro aminopeptidase